MMRCVPRVVFAATAFLAIPWHFAQAQTSNIATIEKALLGQWVVRIGEDQRTRQMIVRDIKQDGNRILVNAVYGWSDANTGPTLSVARIENGAIVFELVNSNNTQILAKSTAGDWLEGTFRYTNGTQASAVLERTSTSTEVRVFPSSPSAIIAATAQPTADQLEELLYGSWAVTIGDNGRIYRLDLRAVKQEGDRRAIDAVYGWTGGEPKPAPMMIGVDNGVVTLDLLTGAGARITVKSFTPRRFVGQYIDRDGKQFITRIMLEGHDAAAEATVASPASAGQRA
jgi:hypothetical protein